MTEEEQLKKIFEKVEELESSMKELKHETKGLLSDVKDLKEVANKKFSAKSDFVNNFLNESFDIRQGQQLVESIYVDQMIVLMKNMENGKRIEFLEYLFHNHFDSRSTGDNELATKYQIEDTLERDLTEDEKLVMKIAYANGYFTGGKDGIDKVLKGKK